MLARSAQAPRRHHHLILSLSWRTCRQYRCVVATQWWVTYGKLSRCVFIALWMKRGATPEAELFMFSSWADTLMAEIYKCALELSRPNHKPLMSIPVCRIALKVNYNFSWPIRRIIVGVYDCRFKPLNSRFRWSLMRNWYYIRHVSLSHWRHH